MICFILLERPGTIIGCVLTRLKDVGGGSVDDEEKHKLSNVPLMWMTQECLKPELETGIVFDQEKTW